MQKKGTVCRFNFPRPPSVKTFISKPIELIEKHEEQFAIERLSVFWDAVKNNEQENISASQVLNQA